MDSVTTARQLILDHPWAVVAVVILAIVLLRGLSMRARMRIKRAEHYAGPPKDGSEVRDSAPIVGRARRQMILTLIALAVVAILVLFQNLR